MSAPRLPWSWPAFVAALLVLGFVQVVGMFFIQGFRRGLDADMEWLMEALSPFDRRGGVASFALIGVPFLLAGRWLANRTVRPESAFLLLVVAAPFLGLRTWALVSAGLEPPSNLVPFEQDGLFYLPNWLELAFVALAFLGAAVTYTHLARHFSVQTAP